MANRNIYSVHGTELPATSVQAWTPEQRTALDIISSDVHFSRWSKLEMTAEEYVGGWTQGPRRVLWVDNQGLVQASWITIEGQIKTLGATAHVYCGMCGDTGLQNGQKCPQAGCRKANSLPPFDDKTQCVTFYQVRVSVMQIDPSGDENTKHVKTIYSSSEPHALTHATDVLNMFSDVLDRG